MRILALILIFINITFANSENVTLVNQIKSLIQKEEYISLAVNKYIAQTKTIPKKDDKSLDWEKLKVEDYLGTKFDTKNPFTGNNIVAYFDDNNNCFIKGVLEVDTKYNTDVNYLYNFYTNKMFRVNTLPPQNISKTKLLIGSQVIYGKLQEEIRKNLKAGNKILFDSESCTYDSTDITKNYFYELKNQELTYKYCKGSYSFDVYQQSPIYLENSSDLPFIKAKIGDVAYVQKNGEWFEYYYQGRVGVPWIPVAEGEKFTNQLDEENSYQEKVSNYIPNAKDLLIRQSGGCMLSNGDIYCWGNNSNKKVGISSYGQLDTSLTPDFINTPIMLKTQIDNVKIGTTTYDISGKKWYNSPYRVKFDKMGMNSTNVCGITKIFEYTEGTTVYKFGGDLYCNGSINSTYYEDLSPTVKESSILKRNIQIYTNKSTQIKNTNAKYLVDIAMIEDVVAILDDNGKIYTIGKNYRGSLGVGKDDNFYFVNVPTSVSVDSNIIFKKIFALRDARTFGAIDSNNLFYIWGERNGTVYNKPTLLSSIKFNPDAIFINNNEFILRDLNKNYYKTTGTLSVQSISSTALSGEPISISYYKDNNNNEYLLYIDENLKLHSSTLSTSSLLTCKEANETSNCDTNSNKVFTDSINFLNTTNNNISDKFANFTNISIFKLDHQIQEIYEDFENDIVGWNLTNIYNGGTQATTFLGRWGSGSSATDYVNKTFSFGSENANKAVTIKFDFYEIDSWDDEIFYVYINGIRHNLSTFPGQIYINGQLQNTTAKTFKLNTNNGGSSLVVSGSSWSGDEEKHQITINTTLDSNGRVRLGFSSTLNEATSNESWGVDNIEIYRTSDNKLLDRNDFEPISGWSNTNTTVIADNGDTTQVPATTFLGRFPSNSPCSGNPCPNESPFILTKTYTFPGYANYEVDIEFDFYEIDTWDGERFEFYVNDVLIAMDHFVMDGQQYLQDSNITGINLQDNIRPETGYVSDQTYRYKIRSKLNSSAQVTLEFRASLEFSDSKYANYWSKFDEGVDNESWGIDNVKVKLRETNKKFVCAMTGVETASQMYCWGNVARSLPILSTSLYDVSKISTINKLFISQDGEKSNQMSYDEFFNDGKLFLKYPTYIGGFDYPFYFR